MSMLDDVSNKNVWMIGAVLMGISLIPMYKSGTTQVMAQSLGFSKQAVKNLPKDITGNKSTENNTSNKSNGTTDKNGLDNNSIDNKNLSKASELGFTLESNGKTATIIDYDVSHGKDVSIPSQMKDDQNRVVTITGIGKVSSDLTNVTGIVSKGITSVKIPNSVLSIGSGAFSGNTIQNINIPDSVLFLGEGAFLMNHAQTLKLSNKLTDIPESAFFGNQLEGLIIPPSVKTIGHQAFAEAFAPNLSADKIQLGDTLENIGKGSFEGSTKGGLQGSLRLPNNLKFIGGNAFDYNDNLQFILHNKEVKAIGDTDKQY